MLVSNWLGPPGAARVNAVLVPLILQELAVLVENGVGSQVGLEHVGARHRNLEELRAEVEAALEGDIDGLIERHAVGRAIVVLGGDFQRPVEWRRRR